GERLGLQRRLEIARIEEVVFDGVTGARDMRVFKALDRAHEFELHVVRQTGGDAVRIHLVGVQAFGLDKNLVRGLVREPHDFVFHRRAVARTYTFDLAGEHRRAIRGGANDGVRALRGRRDVARQLRRMIALAAEMTEYRARLIGKLRREL